MNSLHPGVSEPSPLNSENKQLSPEAIQTLAYEERMLHELTSEENTIRIESEDFIRMVLELLKTEDVQKIAQAKSLFDEQRIFSQYVNPNLAADIAQAFLRLGWFNNAFGFYRMALRIDSEEVTGLLDTMIDTFLDISEFDLTPDQLAHKPRFAQAQQEIIEKILARANGNLSETYGPRIFLTIGRIYENFLDSPVKAQEYFKQGVELGE